MAASNKLQKPQRKIIDRFGRIQIKNTEHRSEREKVSCVTSFLCPWSLPLGMRKVDTATRKNEHQLQAVTRTRVTGGWVGRL